MVVKKIIQFAGIVIFIFLGTALPAQERQQREDPAVNIFLPNKNTSEKPSGKFSENLCVPQYSTGCSEGDGFTDFAVAEIQNYGSGCADNTGYNGWSQYLSLGPAMFIPGNSYDFMMKSGYANQQVTIWIDFNDDDDLTPDEIVLEDFELSSSGQMYTASVPIEMSANPGLHSMRARTNWSSSSADPCASYTYGEAEDYMVFVGEAAFGSMGGQVTLFTGGNPVESATVNLNGELANYSVTTGTDGLYSFEDVIVGDYSVTCSKPGYNLITTEITIVEDQMYTQNFQLTHPQISVNPVNLEVLLEQNQTETETLLIGNAGDGPLNWSASLNISGSQDKDYLDLQFQYPTSGGNGEAGIESDGNFIYTTEWNGNHILKYDPEGNFIEIFTIPGVSLIRDLAYDGTYFYGSSAIPTVYEMDFENKELIGTFTAPVNVRAIAYNDSEDAFYANNWSDNITKFDKSGNLLGSFPCGPQGNNYYGFAYDLISPGGPFLWGYGQAGTSQNELVQIQLPSGNETGFIFDLENILTGPIYNSAGGLFTQPNLIFGKWTLGGLIQNQYIWGLDLGDAQTWLWVNPNAGTLQPGENDSLVVLFDAGDLTGGTYNALIQFTSFPEVGEPEVDVTLTVYGDEIHPCNLAAEINCTDVQLNWGICPEGAAPPDSFNVYRDETLISVVTDSLFTESLLIPGTNYTYIIRAC